jgi:hypothetical protein
MTEGDRRGEWGYRVPDVARRGAAWRSIVVPLWGVVAIESDRLVVPGPSQPERTARRRFARLKRGGSHRLELQHLKGGKWVTVETSSLRIAPGTGREAGQ